MAEKRAAPLEDKAYSIKIRRQITHLPLDISQMDVQFRLGTVYLSGVVKRLPREKVYVDIRKMVEQMVQSISQMAQVRDVVSAYLRVVD